MLKSTRNVRLKCIIYDACRCPDIRGLKVFCNHLFYLKLMKSFSFPLVFIALLICNVTVDASIKKTVVVKSKPLHYFTYNSPIRALISSGTTVTMTLSGSDTIHASTQRVTVQSSDRACTYGFDIDTTSGNYFLLRSGTPYWFIPFDSTHPPVFLSNNGGSFGGECYCDDQTGGCRTYKDDQGTIIACGIAGCTGCCVPPNSAIVNYKGSGVVVSASAVIYNGVLYHQ